MKNQELFLRPPTYCEDFLHLRRKPNHSAENGKSISAKRKINLLRLIFKSAEDKKRNKKDL